MKRLAVIGAVWAAWAVSGVVTCGAGLHWENPNQAGAIKGFIIYATGPAPTATVRKAIVATNRVDISLLLKGAPTGEYSVSVAALGTNGVASERTKAISISWKGDGTGSAGTGSCTTLLQGRETTGVIAQVLQDKAHACVATAFKAETAGHVCKAEIELRKFRKPTGELTLCIWSDFKGRPAALMARSATLLDATQITDGWYEASLDFKLLAGETYWIGFVGSAVDGMNNILWVGGGAGARCHSADGLTWVFGAGEALNFRLYRQ